MAKKKKVADQMSGRVTGSIPAKVAFNKKPLPARPVQTKPAYGTYDPSLDQQERAASRGLGYLLADTQKAGERATVDYGIARGDIETQTGRSLADLLRNRAQAGEDYRKQLSDLSQSYKRLANNQAQRAAAAGVQGGAAAQAAQKRAANETADRAPIDTNYARNMDASRTAEARLGEDRESALGKLLVDYSRGSEDRTSELEKAQAENRFYGLDINELRVDQAKQMNALPVTRADEVVDPVTGRKKKRVQVGRRVGSPSVPRTSFNGLRTPKRYL